MHDEQHDGGPAAHPHRPDRAPPLLSGFVNAVQSNQAVFVLEDERRSFKRDTVLLLVRPDFSSRPTRNASVYTKCTASETGAGARRRA
jgi:hypothetical protein